MIDFWKKGGSPVCHSLKHIHIKAVWCSCVIRMSHRKECTKIKTKRHNVLFQTLKQHGLAAAEMLKCSVQNHNKLNTMRFGSGAEGIQSFGEIILFGIDSTK